MNTRSFGPRIGRVDRSDKFRVCCKVLQQALLYWNRHRKRIVGRGLAPAAGDRKGRPYRF